MDHHRPEANSGLEEVFIITLPFCCFITRDSDAEAIAKVLSLQEGSYKFFHNFSIVGKKINIREPIIANE